MNKRNYIDISLILLFICILVYCIIRFFNEELTMVNVLAALGSSIALIGFVIKIVKDANDAKDKRTMNNESVYRRLSDKYQSFDKVKFFIRDNVNGNGDLKSSKIKVKEQPSPVEIEDFMRFFKDLKWEIDRGNISWDTAKLKFSKYAILLHRHESLRVGIEDYTSSEWQDFRDYCEHILRMK